jgi:hypothetical protein
MGTTRPTPTPARLPVTGEGIPAARKLESANKALKTSRLCDMNLRLHNTWASENHSLHLLRPIGRNACDHGCEDVQLKKGVIEGFTVPG